MSEDASHENLTLFVGQRFRTDPTVSDHKISVYIPDTGGEHDTRIPDIETRISALMYILTKINDGVTRLPWADGVWKRTQGPRTGMNTIERTSIVYSYIPNPAYFVAAFDEIAEFIRRFGRETEQDTVLIELSGEGPQGFQSRTFWVSDFAAP